MQFSLKQLLIAVTIIAVILSLVTMYYRGLTYVETAERVESVAWLPDGARNISYYKSYLFTAYEFDIQEDGFLKWAANYDVRPVQEPVTIRRYTLRAVPLPSLGPNPTAQERNAFKRIEESHHSTITEGYFYEERRRSGGGVSVGYDRKAMRAYFQSNPR